MIYFILLTQDNYLGPNYDLLILEPIENYNFIANFIQIGTDKSKKQIEIIEADLKENETNYKSGIKEYWI